MTTKRYIIVDENSMPLAFHPYSEQLCYVPRVYAQNRFHLKSYTKKEAQRHINTTIRNRKKWGISLIRSYYLMRIV